MADWVKKTLRPPEMVVPSNPNFLSPCVQIGVICLKPEWWDGRQNVTGDVEQSQHPLYYTVEMLWMGVGGMFCFYVHVMILTILEAWRDMEPNEGNTVLVYKFWMYLLYCLCSVRLFVVVKVIWCWLYYVMQVVVDIVLRLWFCVKRWKPKVWAVALLQSKMMGQPGGTS